jgi:FtsZ-binding cell division protein ZapB
MFESLIYDAFESLRNLQDAIGELDEENSKLYRKLHNLNEVNSKLKKQNQELSAKLAAYFIQ